MTRSIPMLDSRLSGLVDFASLSKVTEQIAAPFVHGADHDGWTKLATLNGRAVPGDGLR